MRKIGFSIDRIYVVIQFMLSGSAHSSLRPGTQRNFSHVSSGNQVAFNLSPAIVFHEDFHQRNFLARSVSNSFHKSTQRANQATLCENSRDSTNPRETAPTATQANASRTRRKSSL